MPLLDRLVALAGLDFDFSVDLSRKRFSEVTSTLYVGRRPRADDVEELKSLGITHVISCLPERERASVAFLRPDFRHLFLPLHDSMHEDIAATFSAAFDFAFSKAPAGAKLLVHCEVGVSRSATIAIALRMMSDNLGFLDAFEQVRAERPEVLPNIGFASQLQRLEHAQGPKLQSDPCSLARYLREVCNVPVDVDSLQASLEGHDYDAVAAIRAIFDDEIPRVVQGARR